MTSAAAFAMGTAFPIAIQALKKGFWYNNEIMDISKQD